ncbi:MAG: metallophosphoesterase, partial [Candidatus Bipolaricaulota bacterium]
MNIDLEQISEILKAEGNLVSPVDPDRVVFIGDTHGDFEATEAVFDRYFDDDTVLTFLGDYVDRGPKSRKNIDFLLQRKLDHPERVILLQGNHEGIKYRRFGPVNFWNSLSPGDREKYGDLLAALPLVFSWKNLIAVHGGLPDVEDIHEVERIERGD